MRKVDSYEWFYAVLEYGRYASGASDCFDPYLRESLYPRLCKLHCVRIPVAFLQYPGPKCPTYELRLAGSKDPTGRTGRRHGLLSFEAVQVAFGHRD